MHLIVRVPYPWDSSSSTHQEAGLPSRDSIDRKDYESFARTEIEPQTYWMAYVPIPNWYCDPNHDWLCHVELQPFDNGRELACRRVLEFSAPSAAAQHGVGSDGSTKERPLYRAKGENAIPKRDAISRYITENNHRNHQTHPYVLPAGRESRHSESSGCLRS